MGGPIERRLKRLFDLSAVVKIMLALSVLCMGLTALVTVEVLGLLRDRLPEADLGVRVTTDTTAGASLASMTQASSAWRTVAQSRHLFKPSTRLPTRRRVAGTVEKIRSKLALRGILSLSGQPIAYIEVKGQGVLRLAEGDESDEFKVVRILARSVQLDILGEEVYLQ